MTVDFEDSNIPVKGYLIAAGIPGGLLLWWGCSYVLTYAGATPEEAGFMFPLLKACSWAGLALAALSTVVLANKFFGGKLSS